MTSTSTSTNKAHTWSNVFVFNSPDKDLVFVNQQQPCCVSYYILEGRTRKIYVGIFPRALCASKTAGQPSVRRMRQEYGSRDKGLRPSIVNIEPTLDTVRIHCPPNQPPPLIEKKSPDQDKLGRSLLWKATLVL